jgi:hypothetical protein
MRGALALRIWMCLHQVILLIFSHQLMTSHWLGELREHLVVEEELKFQ